MPTDDQLLELLGEALPPESREPNADRIAALRDAVRETPPSASASPRTPSRRWVAAALVGVAALIAAFFAGGALLDQSETAPTPSSKGSAQRAPDAAERTPEFETTLSSPDGAITADVTVVNADTGRIVHLRSDQLPLPKKDGFYELWFVGKGDAQGKPNRISAGTFRPDSSGRSDVELTAAVDLQTFPTLVVTAEPNDGKPAPVGQAVLRGEAK